MHRKRFLKILAIIFGAIVVIIIIAGLWMMKEVRKFESNDPLVWKKEIRHFKKLDKKNKYPDNAVLFVGSSSIRFWNSLSEDMAPIPVIRRGFGGSKIGDVIYWAPELIYCHNVNKIVVFVGTNDITGHHGDLSPQDLAEHVKKLVESIHEHNPGSTVYYISITPTPDRWKVWPRAKEANNLIRDYASVTDKFKFLDFTEAFLNEKGVPDEKYFKVDGLHLNKEGYAIWTKRIKPLLEN